MPYTTTSYGSWTLRVDPYRNGPDADIDAFIQYADAGWRELLETTGALERIRDAYREAINAALPQRVHLNGCNEFVGPACPDPGEFDGYPVTDTGVLDLAAIVAGVDLAAIVEAHDPELVGAGL